MGAFVRVASVIDVKLGQGILEEVRPAKALAVCNIDRIVHAIQNTCIHWGGQLGEGNLVGSVVTCPGMVGNSM